MVAGTFGGVVAAAIPGFTITMAIVLTLPLTFALPPLQGLAVMLAGYVGGDAGGLFSAALLGIPGTPSSVATTFDAYPMARRGEPGRALAIGIWASFLGTLLSTALLIAAAPPLALVAVKLGPWEYFALIVFALTAVASLVGRDLLKGLIAALLGLWIATVGPDPMMGRERFTFGVEMLAPGFPFLVVLIGVYAISQLLGDLERDAPEERRLASTALALHPGRAFKEVVLRPLNLLRSSLIGAVVGAVPGAGGSIANLLAYDQARLASSHPEQFGTGTPEGVVASESGNSATAGGGLIHLIDLGVPGSAVDAVLMAALMVHGIQVGPRLIVDYPELVYGVFMAMAVAGVLMVEICLSTLRFFLKVILLPRAVLVPAVMVCCVVGAFALNNRASDIYLLALMGVVGYGLRKLDYPLAPLVLGVILGPIAEVNLRRALMIDGDWAVFFTRPGALLLWALALISLGAGIYRHRRAQSTASSPSSIPSSH
ncbi:MAG: tripartite tricarboxylate transporter permease [Candidatus Competibacterales bacterium]